MADVAVIVAFGSLLTPVSLTIAQQVPVTDATVNPEVAKEQGQEQNVSKQHTTDSLTILMLLGLLLLTILTVWLFKHRRFRFVHETGLSMIYGLIVGVIIKFIYYKPASTLTPAHPKIYAVLSNSTNQTFYTSNPPQTVYIALLDALNDTANQTDFKYNLTIETNEKPEPMLERAVTFEPELFFNVILPVIIFEAGYSMKRRHFFKNLGAILMFAFIGTTVSCLVVGGIMFGFTRLMTHTNFTLNDCFLFGAIISATDPVTVLALFHDLHVDVDLYAIVFGESVFNDAVAIVLSGSVRTYGEMSGEGFNAGAFFKALGNFLGIFCGAFAIGSVMGVATALLTKFTKIRDFPLLETALFFLMSYSSFQAAEVAGLTGIVAVLFCGITQAHYTYNNLSPESKNRTKQLFELTNFLAENFVFLYIGVSIFTFDENRIKWDPGFIFASFLAIIAGRLLNVYPLSFLLNLGRKNKIGFNFQHMMMFSGLRGAIAFALAIQGTSTIPRQYMLSATMIIVLATVILCGGLTTPMLQWLKIRVGVDEDLEMQQLPPDTVRTAMQSQRQYSTMTHPSGDQPPSSHVATAAQPCEAEEGHSLPGSPLLEQEPEAATEQPRRTAGKAWLVAQWYNFDTLFMKPLLTNCRPTLIETLPKCCLPFAKLFTTEEQFNTPETHPDNDSDTDMIIDHSQLSIGDSELSIPSNHTDNDTSRKDPIEEAEAYDVGLGINSQPMNLRVNLPGPTGDRV